MNIGVVQFHPLAGRPDDNRDRAVEAIDVAAEAGAELVVLPELFTVGFFAFEAYDSAAEPFEGPTVDRLSATAADLGVAILAGSFLEDLGATTTVETPATEGMANTSVFIDDDGSVRAWYRKHHLFGIGSEEATRLVPGDALGICDFGDFTIGITTCYDLRFPELSRRYLDEDVSLMLVPSAWPDARPEHWQVLSRARAIENQWYLVAANGVGNVAGTTLLGHSLVYDPWGNATLELGEEPAVDVVEVDPERVATVRDGFPVLADRRE